MQEAKEAPQYRFHLQRFLVFVILVLAVIGVALYSFFRINPLDIFRAGFSGTYEQVLGAMEETNQKVIEIPTDGMPEQTSHAVLSDNIIVGSANSVKCFDKNGNQLWHVPVSLKKPLVQTQGSDVLVADIGGRYFGVIRDGMILWDRTLDVDIVNAGIYENWVLVITRSNQAGYRRIIHAFSREGQSIVYRNVSDYYPFAIYHYPRFDHTAFIVCGIDARSLETTSLFEFLDLSMNQRGSIRDSQGREDLFAGALPFSGERLLLYGEKDLICVGKDLGRIWHVDLGNDFLTSCGITPDDITVAAVLDGEILNREKRTLTRLKAIDSKGSVQEWLVLDAEVTQIRAKGRTIACAAGSEVYFLNGSGEVIDVYTSLSKVDSVCLASESLAYVSSGGKLTAVRINVPKKFLGIF